MSEGAQSPSQISELFALFAHHRRRYALRELRQHTNPMTLADLADEIAIRENETPLAEVPAEEVKRIYMSLYHTHIPKLEEADLVHYDQEQDTLTLTDRAERITRNRDLFTVD